MVSVLFCALEEILMHVFYMVYFNNLVIANFGTLPILFSIYLAYYLHKDFTPPVRRVIGITGLTGLIAIVVLLCIYPTDQFLNTVQAISSAALVLLALYYFIHKVFFTTQFEIGRHPLFYISSALLVYHATVSGIMSSYSLLEQDTINSLWTLKLIAYIFYNAAIGYGFYIFSRYRLSL
jgi:hypothetical protein